MDYMKKMAAKKAMQSAGKFNKDYFSSVRQHAFTNLLLYSRLIMFLIEESDLLKIITGTLT